MCVCVCVCVCVWEQGVQVKPAVRDSQWYDVGIVKVTNMVVSHYYVPYEDNMADVSAENQFTDGQNRNQNQNQNSFICHIKGDVSVSQQLKDKK